MIFFPNETVAFSVNPIFSYGFFYNNIAHVFSFFIHVLFLTYNCRSRLMHTLYTRDFVNLVDKMDISKFKTHINTNIF